MKLTPLAKGFIALVILGAVGYLGYHFYGKEMGKGATAPGASDGGGEKAAAPKRGPKRIVVGVNDFGGAYAGLVANDGAAAGSKSRAASRFGAAGLDVEFKIIRGSKERLAAFDSGEVDVMLLTLDYLANLVPGYRAKGVELKAFLMADWSRGNMGLVAKPGITSIEGLKDAKIATTRNTPTHYFILSLLRNSNLTQAEVEKVKGNLVFATKTPLAGEMFQRGEVDAVAIWEPHLSESMKGGKGRLLVSTATATNLVADVLFARSEFLKEREAEMAAFAKAWFEGVAELERDPEAQLPMLATAFGQPAAEIRGVLGKIKPAKFADNRVFFGLEREKAPYFTLFDEASRFWQREGVIKEVAQAGETRWLKALEAVAKDHTSEKVEEAWKFSAPRKDAAPLLTKSVSIYFASGADKLDPNAKKLIDEFAETLAEFGNAYVQVEGNTDNVGARGKNVELSRRRAEAVVSYLATQHGFDRARFKAVGNGPDKPVGDNGTEAGRDVNRRTDFRIIPNN
jgi:NitT/TauT family transport system substrate-binding protein